MIDPSQRCVRDDQGMSYRYEKLLLATGGTPRRLASDSDSILYFRTLADYQYLRSLTQDKTRFAVIGGGFIGAEIAASLTMNGKSVVMIFPEQGIGSRIFPPDLSRFLNDFYREKGVEVRAGETVETVSARDGKLVVETRRGLRRSRAGDRSGRRRGRAWNPAERRIGPGRWIEG